MDMRKAGMLILMSYHANAAIVEKFLVELHIKQADLNDELLRR